MDFTSPFLKGGGAPDFGPPSGLAGIIAGRERNNTDLALGAGRNMASLVQNLQDYSERQKAINNAGKAADYAVKANPQMLTDMGIHPDAWQNFAPQDKADAVSGYTKAQGVKEAAQVIADQQAQMQAAAAKMQEQKDADEGIGKLGQALGDRLEQDPETPLGIGDLFKAFQGVKLNPRVQAATMKAVMPGLLQSFQADGGENPLQVDTNSVPGATIVSRKRGNQFQVVPNPPDLSAGAAAVNDKDGNLLGYNVPTGKGKFQFQPVKTMTDGQKQTVILGHEKAIDSLLQQLPFASGQTNVLEAINEQVGQHRAAIAQLSGGEKAKAAAAPAEEKKDAVAGASALPTVTTKSDFDKLAKGARYVGKDGQTYQKP